MLQFIVKSVIDLFCLINLLKDSYTKKGDLDFKTFSMKLDIDSLESQVLNFLQSSNEIHIKIDGDSFEVIDQDTKENLDKLEICDDQLQKMFYHKLQNNKIEEIVKLFQDKHSDFISFLKKEGSQFNFWDSSFIYEDVEFCFQHAFISPSVSKEEECLNWHELKNDYLLGIYEEQVNNLFDTNDLALIKWFEIHEGLDFNSDYKVHCCPNDINSLDCFLHSDSLYFGEYNWEFRFKVVNEDLYMDLFSKGIQIQQEKVESLNQDLSNLKEMYRDYAQNFIYNFVTEWKKAHKANLFKGSLKCCVYVNSFYQFGKKFK